MPGSIFFFIGYKLDFTIIAKDNIITTRYRDIIVFGTTNNNTVTATGKNHISFTIIVINRLNGSCTTSYTIGLLLKYTIFLGNFGTNNLTSLSVIYINFFITQIRNNFTLSILILDITLIAECNHTLFYINIIATFATENNHTIFGNLI